jgi:2'-5' RNA ligase
MVFFLSWIFETTGDEDEDHEGSTKTVSFKITAHDFGTFDDKQDCAWMNFQEQDNVHSLGNRLSSSMDKLKPMRDQERNC